jgi:excisionase family DNA binding protein
MIKRGDLPAQKVGKVYRIPRAEVERFLHVQAVMA